MSQLPIAYREMREEDTGLIYNSWLKSNRQAEPNKQLSNSVYFYHHKEVIGRLLESPSVSVAMICSSEDDTQLFGYAVTEHSSSSLIIHYAYIKYNYRKLGLMAGLLGQLGISGNNDTPVSFITHLPRLYSKVKEKYNLVYNPYLLER